MDPDDRSKPPPTDDARTQAEARFAQRSQAAGGDDPARVSRLLHDLGVHQIELELQNEELQRAYLALEASRDRYLDLFENAPVAYLSIDLAGTIVESNGRAHGLLGRQGRALHGTRVIELIAPGYRNLYKKYLARVMGGEGEQAFELALALAAEREVWIDLRMSLVAGGAEGGALQMRCALMDISDRVLAQRGAARLAAVVASSEDAIASRDLDGRVTSWNAAAERLFGRREAEMLGHRMDALMPDGAQRLQDEELLRRVQEGERVDLVETARLAADGHAREVSMSLSRILGADGEVAGSALIARDVTALRQAERELAQRLRQLELLAVTGGELILGDAAEPSAAQRLYERAGRSVGSEIQLDYVLGSEPGTLELRSAQGLPEAARSAMAVVGIDRTLCGLVARGGRPLVVEALQDSDLPQAGTLKDAGVRSYAGFPVMAKDRLFGVTAFASTTQDRFDDGDLQVLQAVCAQVGAMLERKALLDDLHASEGALRRADRAKDEFIAILAHELRNPLAPIRNALAILKHGGIAGDADAEADARRDDWCRDIIERQVAHMTRLLEDLLDVSRVTRHQVQLRPKPMDLREAVQQAVETARPLIETKRHRLTLALPEQPAMLHGDLTRLTQIVTNLLTNAAKYTDARGDIALDLARDGEAWRIAVRDNGIGIEPGQLQHVFDMFAQLTPALERSAGGLGIGLSLTRGLVELHGGRIEARSSGAGGGSEFVVHLPVRGVGEEAAETQPGALATGPLPRRRVLVVDDNVDGAESLAQLMTLDGHEVRTAFAGDEGLQLAREWRPEVLLLDIGMGGMNGYELCRSVRAEPWGQGVLTVACTGWGQPADRERASEAGFDAHLVKPIEPAALSKLLARWTQRA